MSSFPRALEKHYDEVDSEIVDKLDFEPYLQILKAWFKNFDQLRQSLGQLDDLSRAECYLLLESLKSSAQILKARATGAEVTDSMIAYAREVGFVYEQFLTIHNQLKAQRTQRLHKILSATSQEDNTLGGSDGPERSQKAAGMTMNLKSLLPEDFEAEESGGGAAGATAGSAARSDIYKAPQSSTLSILGHNFEAEDKARRKEQRSKQNTAARLNRSEFVTALTEDYTETPQIHDDGFDQLDAESRKTLERFEAEERGGQDDSGDDWSLPMKKRMRKTADLKKYKEIKTKQSLLRSGAEMGDLADFVGRINNDENETTEKTAGSNKKKSAGAGPRRAGKKTTKLRKIKKRVK